MQSGEKMRLYCGVDSDVTTGVGCQQDGDERWVGWWEH